MRNEGEGSKVARGRKKRRKLRPSAPETPATTAQTIRLRNLFIGGSGSLATIGPAAGGFVTGFAAAFVTPALTAEVGVEVVFDAPDAGVARAAAGVEAGGSLAGASPRGAGFRSRAREGAGAAGGATGAGGAG